MSRYRIRSMKPEAFQHRKVGRLSIWARWLWVGMLHHADDAGRLIADHGQLRGLMFMYDADVTEAKVGDWLAEIAVSGLVVLYNGPDGTPLACFPDWSEHQRIDRPTGSRLPAPPSEKAPRKRPHRKTGRIPSGRPPREKAPEAYDHEELASTNARRGLDDVPTTPRAGSDRNGSDRIGSEQLHLPSPRAADAAVRVESLDVEAEILNGHRPVTGKTKKLKRREDDPPGFAEFYEHYPKHEGREEAAKQWAKLGLGTADLSEVLAGVDRWRATRRWRDGYIMEPGRFLREKRWKEHPVPATGLSAKTSGNVEAVRQFSARMREIPA